MEILQIPLSSVKPSPMNPRKTFDENDLKELAENIEKQGLLQPITVRPKVLQIALGEEVPDGYEIVCGERRYRAVSILKEKEDQQNVEKAAAHRKKSDRFQTISAIVRELNDEDAFDAMITENLQRKDVDPIEEAFAFGQLIEKGKTPEDIAVRFGKSIRFVQDRCKLNALIPELMAAIKDDTMSISAAMIICKLDDEQQKHYYKSYSNNSTGFTKATAESFTNSLFMSLDRAPWSRKEYFDGGCNCKCSECQFNTANHGCLFWDMKNENAGKCTNRDMFYKKHSAFIISELERFKDKLVEVGKPLESGKILIIDCNDWCSPATKALKPNLYNEIKAAGYEVAKSEELFEGQCYDNGAKLKQKQKLGKIYHCLRIFSYDNISLTEEWRYFKGASHDDENNENTTQATSSQSVDAMSLIQKKERAKEIAIEDLSAKMRQMANEIKECKQIEEITDDEQLAFDIIVFTLCGTEMQKRYGHKGYGKPSDPELIDVIKRNQANRAKWIREFIRNTISSADMNYNKLYQFCAEKVLSIWKPQQYSDMKSEITQKLDKKLAKIDAKLKELGYDSDGKLLSK